MAVSEETLQKQALVMQLQEKGLSIDEIISRIEGINTKKSLNNLMSKGDPSYRFDRVLKKYVLKEGNTQSDTDCITSENVTNLEACNTTRNTVGNTESNTRCITTRSTEIVTLEPNKQEVIEVIANEQETLLEMLKWFKKYRTTMKEDIVIELPLAKNTMITCRGNEAIWEQFGAFADKHKSFSKGDLLSQALKEFMEKYN